MANIGVFICWCGENIGRTVDCPQVAEQAALMPGVVHAVDYKYMCSEPGQNLIREAVKEKKLTGVVVCACSPLMHEATFRRACADVGLNPYLCEIANLREQCSWVHESREAATAKAVELVRIMVEKVKRNEALVPIKVPVTKKALVIGGGIAGIQAALDIANGGHQVILVERDPSIGGHMAQLSETFPTLDCSQCILTPRMVEAAAHSNITLHTYAEVEEIKGFVGNFEVKIRLKARCVDMKKCTGCGLCMQKCPSGKIPSEFNEGLGFRTAIYTPFAQAVPNKPVIDREHCLKFTKEKCGVCQKVCPTGAVDYEQQDEILTEKVGAVVVATGFRLFDFGQGEKDRDIQGYGEYGYGRYPDVIDGLQFERLASASGPTNGEIRRPSDGKVPETVVFLKCIGSRDNAKGITYCSKVCCMYVAKHALLYKHKVHHGKAYVFYMDIRSSGKNYDEFVRRVIEEEEACYIRGRVSSIYKKGDKLVVAGADTLLGGSDDKGGKIEIEADMVVLATAIRPAEGIRELAAKLRIGYDGWGFLSEAHAKLRPVESSSGGFFLAGACHGPKDIPETVSQAGCAAAKVLSLFSGDELTHEPIVAWVNEKLCSSCGLCVKACPYGARELDKAKGSAKVIEVLCEGCGTCTAICPNKACQQRNFSQGQILSMMEQLL